MFLISMIKIAAGQESLPLCAIVVWMQVPILRIRAACLCDAVPVMSIFHSKIDLGAFYDTNKGHTAGGHRGETKACCNSQCSCPPPAS